MTKDKKDESSAGQSDKASKQPDTASAETGKASSSTPTPVESSAMSDLSSSDRSSGGESAAKSTPPPSSSAPKRRAPLWMLFLLLLLAFCCMALAYLGWYELEAQQVHQQQLAQQLEKQEQMWFETQKEIGKLDLHQKQQLTDWSNHLDSVEQQVEQHSRRLKSLSTTTRDDWLLAEAEYLMRLANQRMLMERGTQGALGLLESADDILAELDSPDLFGVRDRLSRDIATLKLTPAVDRSGLYLRLAALADKIEQLPDLPRIAKDINEGAEPVVPHDSSQGGLKDSSFWTRLKDQFLDAMDKLKHQVRIRHHDKPLEPLLPPDGARYLRQNIRFNLEQAQLAMLREENTIYRHSLQQAEDLLRQYFANQSQALMIADQLQELSETDVVVTLPSISGSLAALQDYIDKLHLLDDNAGRPQLDGSASDSGPGSKSDNSAAGTSDSEASESGGGAQP
ncbi:uroporphyrinogen-III C-methyltransferase [Pseudomaricurvus sp.]|uniref:uroporphyrinogen-III C-methyltransferase n=1 Tax=Pseudomaricurvus sp. TaxID=2004510 RepID=UPI003F6D9B08